MDINVNLNMAYVHSGVSPKADILTADRAQLSTSQPTKDDKVKPEIQDVKEAVESIQHFIESAQRNLEFSIDESTDQVVVKVINKASGELIRQMPSEEALQLAQRMKEDNPVLFQAKA